MEYGLIGFPLEHSFSQNIHEALKLYPYEIKSLKREELDSFLKSKNFKGINVTIPYKQDVLSYLDFLDETVKLAGSCNTIINQEGRLYGFNTDYKGFAYLLDHNQIEVKDKIIAILGKGGTYKTINAVCQSRGAKHIYCISDKPEDGLTSFAQLYQKEVTILINATPVGMYPDTDKILVDLDRLKQIECIIDVVYNPLNTKLIVEARLRKIKAVGGLEMLVAQAVYAAELFTNQNLDKFTIPSLHMAIATMKKNIVLIGMPMCGKTTVGKLLAKELTKEFVDIDTLIEDRQHMRISQIFDLKGEAHFRMLEGNMARHLASKNDLVISTGGGIIENSEVMKILKQNAFVVYVTRDFDKMIYSENRPLVKNAGDIEKIYLKRDSLYRYFADSIVANNGSVKTCVTKIVEVFHEDISN